MVRFGTRKGKTIGWFTFQPCLSFMSGGRFKHFDSCHGRVIRNQQNLFPIFLLLP